MFTRIRLVVAALVAAGAVGAGGAALITQPHDPAATLHGLSGEQVNETVDDGYEREAFGSGWIDADRDRCNTRAEVLIRDLDNEVVVREVDGRPTCRVVEGDFSDPYTGFSGRAIASELDIDHTVSLHDAWTSGAVSWHEEKRIAFANDERNLVATNEVANRCKGDKRPAEWDLPPGDGSRTCDNQRAPQDPKLRCAYAERYTDVKARWGLSVTNEDRHVLTGMLAGC